jgi:hypothetical protein
MELYASNILLGDRVTVDGFWIDGWIYWTIPAQTLILKGESIPTFADSMKIIPVPSGDCCGCSTHLHV